MLDSPPALAWMANYGAVELHPWTSTVDDAAPADVGVHRHRPRREDDLRRRRSCWPASTAPRSTTSACAAAPKVTGKRGIQIWVPVAAATRSTTPGPGSRRCRARSATTVPELVSWEWKKSRARRPGPARLHPERHQQDAGRAVQRPAGARRAGVGADHVGRARRPRPAARPLDDPHRPRPPRHRRRSPRCPRRPPADAAQALTRRFLGQRTALYAGPCPRMRTGWTVDARAA